MLEPKMCNCMENSKYWDLFEAVMKNYTGEESQLIPCFKNYRKHTDICPRM